MNQETTERFEDTKKTFDDKWSRETFVKKMMAKKAASKKKDDDDDFDDFDEYEKDKYELTTMIYVEKLVTHVE